MARTRTGPTPAELALLGLLAEGAAHPYSLDAKLRAGVSSAEVAFSSIYAALDRLEKLGLVASRPDAGARGKARRVYRLTPLGRATLKTAARESLARPFLGPRPNDLGIAHLMLLPKVEALAAIAEARRSLGLERKARPANGEEYPENAVLLHRHALLGAEDRFYGELERIVQRSHPDRARRRPDEEAE